MMKRIQHCTLLLSLLGLLFLAIPSTGYAASTPPPMPNIVHVEKCNPAGDQSNNDTWEFAETAENKDEYVIKKVGDHWEVTRKDGWEFAVADEELSAEVRDAGGHLYGWNPEEEDEARWDRVFIIPNDPVDKKTQCEPVAPEPVEPSPEVPEKPVAPEPVEPSPEVPEKPVAPEPVKPGPETPAKPTQPAKPVEKPKPDTPKSAKIANTPEQLANTGSSGHDLVILGFILTTTGAALVAYRRFKAID